MATSKKVSGKVMKMASMAGATIKIQGGKRPTGRQGKILSNTRKTS